MRKSNNVLDELLQCKGVLQSPDTETVIVHNYDVFDLVFQREMYIEKSGVLVLKLRKYQPVDNATS